MRIKEHDPRVIYPEIEKIIDCTSLFLIGYSSIGAGYENMQIPYNLD